MMEMKTIWRHRDKQGRYSSVCLAAPHRGFHRPGIYLCYKGKQWRVLPLWGKGY